MAFGVILGALGAHSLKPLLSEASLESFQTGVRYHLIHALALFSVGLAAPAGQLLKWRWPIRLILLSLVFFSGSIYLLSTMSISGLDILRPILGPITPIGGFLWIGSWVWMAVSYVDDKRA